MKPSFNKKWLMLEREDYANYLFVVASWEGYTSSLPKQWGFRPSRFLGAEYVNSSCNLFVTKDEYDEANEEYFRMLFTKPRTWDRLHRATVINADDMFFFARRVKKIHTQKLSNHGLIRLIDKFQKHQQLVHDPRGPMWLLETPDNLVSDYLRKYLSEKAESTKPTVGQNEAFRVLCVPLQKSIWEKEKEELARIALIADKERRLRALKRHTKKYEWLEYGLQGKMLGLDHFEKELTVIRQKGAKKILQDMRQERTLTIRLQKKIFKEYGIHERHQKIFRIVQDSFYTRLYSKDSQFFGYYCIEGLFKEFGRRTGLGLEQVRFLAPPDFATVLLKGKDFNAITHGRQKYSIHISDRGKTVYYYGDAARKLRRKLHFFETAKDVHDSEIITGQPAYVGKATGRVKIINTIPEMVKMHPGNVLVSHMTNPGIVPVMKQAVAIVTDLGGITCHAAIIARELKKPCIIGTKIATKVLKDGDTVEVDAERGIIKKI